MPRGLWVCLAVSLSLSAAVAAEIEVTAPARITPPGAFSFYNTTGITIGRYLYLYMQGTGAPGEDASCSIYSDKIIAWRAPIIDGVPGALERVGRVSPCVNAPVTDPGHPAHPNPPASFGPGQIFEATVGRARKYHLLADVSDTINFSHVWRGESSDGINWTWFISDAINNQQFNGRRETIRDASDVVEHSIDIVVQPESFIHSTSISMLNPILVANPNVNNAQWWGFFNYWDCGFAIGRMTVDWDPTGTIPTVKMVASIDASKYVWLPLTPTGSVAGSFLLDFTPKAFRENANAKTLMKAPRAYEHQLWASAHDLGQYSQDVDCDTSKDLLCDLPGGCPTGDGVGCPYGLTCNAFLRNTGAQGDLKRGGGGVGFVFWPATRTSFGAENIVYSRSRHLPSGYSESRLFPFRWTSPTGRNYLFSSTNDANVCDEFLFSAFYKMYVVRTELGLE
jgi:hypothetical protein